MQRDVWPLLVDAGVDAAFGGHNHVYQRHCAFDWRTAGGETRDEDGHEDGDEDDHEDGHEDGAVQTNTPPTTPRLVLEGCAVVGPLARRTVRGAWAPSRERGRDRRVRRPSRAGEFRGGFRRRGIPRTATGAAFSEVTAYEYGYLRLVAANRTHLTGNSERRNAV